MTSYCTVCYSVREELAYQTAFGTDESRARAQKVYDEHRTRHEDQIKKQVKL